MRAERRRRAVALRLLWLGAALSAALPSCRLGAQDLQALSVTGDQAPKSTKVLLTAGMIVAGAAGTQTVKTPDAWERTWSGFGARVADQTGFYLVQTGTLRSLRNALDYRPDAVLCPRAALVRCAFAATFTAFDRRGQRRFNVPLMGSVVAGTAASLAWRPERHENGESWAFVGTRMGIVIGGYVVERIVVDWWAQRPR